MGCLAPDRGAYVEMQLDVASRSCTRFFRNGEDRSLGKGAHTTRAAQQGHYLANTELLKSCTGGPVQLGETHLEFTFAAVVSPIFVSRIEGGYLLKHFGVGHTDKEAAVNKIQGTILRVTMTLMSLHHVGSPTCLIEF